MGLTKLIQDDLNTVFGPVFSVEAEYWDSDTSGWIIKLRRYAFGKSFERIHRVSNRRYEFLQEQMSERWDLVSGLVRQIYLDILLYRSKHYGSTNAAT